MKLISTDFGHAIRFMKVEHGRPQLLYGINVAKSFEAKYGFLEGPRTVKDFDLSKGVTFSHGFFKGTVLIDKIKIYDNGIVVESKSDTDNCVEIIMDVVEWAKNEVGIVLTPNTESPDLYMSSFEVQMDCDLAAPFGFLDGICKRLEKFLNSYRMPLPNYEASGFQIGDRSSKNTPFRFERRTGRAFSENVYFSMAPLKTKDHLSLLESLETLVASSPAASQQPP